MISGVKCRPFTSMKSTSRGSRSDSRILISSLQRPTTSQHISLTKIIKVIQNTLNQGAQNTLIKSKSIDRYSKTKIPPQTNTCKYFKKHLSYKQCQTQPFSYTPNYKSYKLIDTNQMRSQNKNLLTCTKTFNFWNNEQFIPYSRKKDSIFLQEQEKPVKKQRPRPPIKKKSAKFIHQKQNTQSNLKVNEFNVIDQWQDDTSEVHFSALFENILKK